MAYELIYDEDGNPQYVDTGDNNVAPTYPIFDPTGGPSTVDPWYYDNIPSSDAESGGSGSGTTSVGGNIFGGNMGTVAEPNSSLTNWINSQFGSSMTGKQLASLGLVGAGGLAGALTSLNKPKITPVGYQGKIPELVANRTMVTAPPPGHVPGSGGINYGGDVTYTPVVKAAHGGLMGMARGGSTGRYLQGSTDGMADKLPTTIDGKQPAALSHGEFVVPADVVSHLGNGNSDAGAKKLYSMMDKIRQARTGTKKQGKRINADKFMPGGSVGYAEGGSVMKFAGETGSTVPAGTTGVNQTLASWTGDYVPNMLAQGQALANAPYQQYTGQLTAGPSDLQSQAFGTAANLQTPSAIGQAATTAGGIASAAQNIGYNPMQATSQFNAPAAYQAAGTPQYNQLNAGNVSSSFQAPSAYQTGNFSNQFTAPTQSAATNFTNQYQAPTPYSGIQASTGTFGSEQAQQYMNPYLQQALNPQLTEARRQADITAAQNAAQMTKAGAFGGGRQAILAAENQRNLGINLADITGKGYNTAYTNAQNAFTSDQARNLQAQQANIGQQQFGATQNMNAAQLQAQYGLSAQQAQEAARQFNQGQAMTGAQAAAQYGLAGQQATEASRQFGANQGLQAATTAGSQGLQAALANQQAGLTAGQGNINAALAAAQQAEASRQFGAQQGMTGAQNAAQYGQAAQAANIGQQQFGANLGLQGLQTGLQAAQAQGQLGATQNATNLANLSSQAGLGATQQGITQAGLTADQAAFAAARDNPYKMLQFQQSLLNGLPISATNYTSAGTSDLQNLAGGATTVNQLLATLGLSPTQTGAVPPKV